MQTTTQHTFSSSSSAQPTPTHPKEGIMNTDARLLSRTEPGCGSSASRPLAYLIALLLLALNALSPTIAAAQCTAEFYTDADFSNKGFSFSHVPGSGTPHFFEDSYVEPMHLFGYDVKTIWHDIGDNVEEFFDTLPPDTEWDQNYNWNDKISSFRFVGNCDVAKIVFYEDIEREGQTNRQITLTGFGIKEFPNLEEQGFNDVISSWRLYFDPSHAWAEYHGVLAKDIGMTADGTAMIVGTDGLAYENLGSGWGLVHGISNLQRIDLSQRGTGYVVTDNGSLFNLAGGHVPNMNAKDIGVGADGTVMAVSLLGEVWKMPSFGVWERQDGIDAVSRIDVGPNGMAVVVRPGAGTFDEIYRQTSSGWDRLPGNFWTSDVSIDNQGRIWASGINGVHYQAKDSGDWMDTNFLVVDGNSPWSQPVSISTHDQAWVIRGNGTIFQISNIDNNPPVITLNGANPVVLSEGQSYTDPGATALDEGVTPVGVTINGGGLTNPVLPGKYTMVYTATDARGNVATARRTVLVQANLPFSSAETIEFNGTESTTVIGDYYQLPNSFTFSADVRIDASSPHNFIIDIGGKEAGYEGAFRLEVANEGQWYVAFGDRQSYADAEFMGGWTYGAWTQVTVTYDDGVCTIYENYQPIHTFTPDMDVTLGGTLVLGSLTGTSAFLDGALRNVSLKEGVHAPQADSESLWQQALPGVFAQDISIGSDGTVKIATPTGAVFTLTESGWAENYNMGSVARLAVDPQGYAWVVRESGAIFQQDNSGWHEKYNMQAQDIGVGADGTVKIATPTGAVFTQTASGWAENYNMGSVARLAVDPQGYAWAVKESGAIFQQDNSGWHEKYNALAQDIGVGADGTVWITTPTGEVYAWTDTGWETVYDGLPGEAQSIHVAPDGNPWVTLQDGTIFKWDE